MTLTPVTYLLTPKPITWKSCPRNHQVARRSRPRRLAGRLAEMQIDAGTSQREERTIRRMAITRDMAAITKRSQNPLTPAAMTPVVTTQNIMRTNTKSIRRKSTKSTIIIVIINTIITTTITMANIRITTTPLIGIILIRRNRRRP